MRRCACQSQSHMVTPAHVQQRHIRAKHLKQLLKRCPLAAACWHGASASRPERRDSSALRGCSPAGEIKLFIVSLLGRLRLVESISYWLLRSMEFINVRVDYDS